MMRNSIKSCSKILINNIFNVPKSSSMRIIHSSILQPICPRILKTTNYIIQNIQPKSKTSKKQQKSDSDTDSNNTEDYSDEIQDRNTKVMNINVTSLRVDAILKNALGIARNKIEIMFYESKIRVNGEKITKKSTSVREGDEIDLIKGPDLKNPNFINVARVEILSIKAAEESIKIKLKRCKSLIIEAYQN